MYGTARQQPRPQSRFASGLDGVPVLGGRSLAARAGAATIGDDFDGSPPATSGLEVEGSTAVAHALRWIDGTCAGVDGRSWRTGMVA
jgi:hypothetical protein